MKKKVFLLVSALFCCMAISANERPVTLNQCIQLAMQHHPDMKISVEDRKIAMYNYQLIKSQNTIIVNGEVKTVEFLKPTAASSTGFSVPGVDSDIGLFAGMTAVYSIYDPKRKDAEASSREMIDLSKIQQEKSKNDLVYNVKKNYFEYRMAVENLKIAEQTLEKYKQKLKLADVLFKTGQRPILDLSRAEVGVAQAEFELGKAKNYERLIKVQLLKAIGVMDTKIDINPVKIEKLPLLRYSVEELSKLAELYYPEIQIIRAQKRISKIKIDIEDSANYPKVDIIMALGYDNKNLQPVDTFYENFYRSNWNPSFYGTARAYFPIYTGGAISSRVNTSISEYNKMLYRERDLVQGVEILISSAVKGLEELTAQITMAELIYQNSQKHLILSQKSYENGIGTLLDLQDAELNVISSQKSYENTIYLYLMTMANISRIVGLPEELICKNN